MKNVKDDRSKDFGRHTLASAAGLTLPLTAKAPPRITICPIFPENPGSSWMACMIEDIH